MSVFRILTALAAPAALLLSAGPAPAKDTLPILVPLTSFIALEGTSQKNGALLAIEDAKSADKTLDVEGLVLDTASSPQTAVRAFDRALRTDGIYATFGPIDGNSMLALLPRVARAQVPILTVSGTAKLTEQGNPWLFRFFPSDAVVKTAQARYVVEELKRRKIALVVQNTAYGQSGQAHLKAAFAKLGARAVYETTLTVRTKEMLPVLANVKRSGADVLVLQLHSGSTALLIKQAAAFGLKLPIVAGSAMHQPTTAALLEPAMLANVCAETASSPVSGGSAEMKAFADRYRKRYSSQPDAFAVGDYDAMRMVLTLRGQGIKTAAAMRRALAISRYRGLAMTYRSDGKGNMAHDAIIVCYDGKSRVPKTVKRYENVLKMQ